MNKLLIRLHSEAFHDRSIGVVGILARQIVEVLDRVQVGEHVGDRHQDCLDRVYTLKLAQEVDVEIGILGALLVKDSVTLRDGLHV